MSDLANIEHLETDLWDAADNLRANSKLTAGEYCMPVLGVIFLRHATNRYNEALREIQAVQAAGKMPKRSAQAVLCCLGQGASAKDDTARACR